MKLSFHNQFLNSFSSMLKQGFVVDQTYQKAFNQHIYLIMQMTHSFLWEKVYWRAQIEIEAKSNMKILDCFGFFCWTLIINDTSLSSLLRPKLFSVN